MYLITMILFFSLICKIFYNIKNLFYDENWIIILDPYNWLINKKNIRYPLSVISKNQLFHFFFWFLLCNSIIKNKVTSYHMYDF